MLENSEVLEISWEVLEETVTFTVHVGLLYTLSVTEILIRNFIAFVRDL